ncbi:DUF7020 family protein, partial [Bacillus cereus]|uniref:DUF7020 family protein n=1 Tax=Bacillus cereus TaxID=1396 RepID=UPI0034D51C09
FYGYANRNETIYFVDRIHYFELDHCVIDGRYYEGSLDDPDEDPHDFMTVEILNNIKERLLQKNIKGCTYDW